MDSIRSLVPLSRTESRAWFAILIGVAAASVGGCTSKKGPSESSKTVVDLRITGPNALLNSQSATYSATRDLLGQHLRGGECHVDLGSGGLDPLNPLFGFRQARELHDHTSLKLDR